MPSYVLKCDHGDYGTGIIGDPYGIPKLLVKRCVEMHEKGHPGHKVKVVEKK